MDDRQSIYKQCLKDVAAQLNLSVTFMAKVVEDRAGSGCHLNLSLWRDGTNLFAHHAPEAGHAPSSDAFRWFLGGWLLPLLSGPRRSVDRPCITSREALGLPRRLAAPAWRSRAAMSGRTAEGVTCRHSRACGSWT